MPFDSNGLFTRTFSCVDDRDANITIRAEKMDTEFDGVATGLSACILKNGDSTVSADIPFSDYKITGLGDATAATDALNRQTADARYLPLAPLGTPAQGDIVYYDGSDYVSLSPGTDGYVLKTQGAGEDPIWAEAAGGGGSGDLVGPESSTDNTVPRFDSTTGKLLQGSGIVIDDSNNVTNMGTLNGRNLSNDASKLDNIETAADVTDEANVTGALSGATLTGVTVADSDKVLIQDTDDTDALKSVTAKSIADLKTDEEIQDVVGAMVASNTETRITVTYEDGDGTLDFVVDDDLSNYDNSTSGFLTSVDADDISVTSEARGDILFRGASGWERLAAGTSGKFLKTQSTSGDPVWETIPGGGDMLAANNLSDVDDAATARANLGISAATDLFALALRVADLEGDALGIVDGIADPFDDETDVDTTSSTNEYYYADGDYYRPTFTSASPLSGASGTNIGDAIGGGGLAAAFDGDTTQVYSQCALKGTSTAFIGKTYSSPQKIHSASVYSSSDFGFDNTASGLITINLYAKTGTEPASSTDGTLLGTNTITDSNETLQLDITSSDIATEFDHVWVEITSSGSEIRIAEVIFSEPGVNNNMTLVSEAFTAEAEPDTARLLFQIKPIDSITINTDVIGSVSRDGGTTFTTSALVEVLEYSDGTKLYEDDSIDISGQPSGTSMMWKLTTANNKQIQCSGVVLQWSE